jgi:hypothetical protein
MEDEIAAVFVNFVRSIAVDVSANTVLSRVHFLRNMVVLRMDWRNAHCPAALANHILVRLNREGGSRWMMAIVCDLVFAPLIGHETYFTEFITAAPPHGPIDQMSASTKYPPIE